MKTKLPGKRTVKPPAGPTKEKSLGSVPSAAYNRSTLASAQTWGPSGNSSATSGGRRSRQGPRCAGYSVPFSE